MDPQPRGRNKSDGNFQCVHGDRQCCAVARLRPVRHSGCRRSPDDLDQILTDYCPDAWGGRHTREVRQEGRPRGHQSLSGAFGRTVGDGRVGKHRGRRRCDFAGRPGGSLLDVGRRVLRNGDQDDRSHAVHALPEHGRSGQPARWPHVRRQSGVGSDESGTGDLGPGDRLCVLRDPADLNSHRRQHVPGLERRYGHGAELRHSLNADRRDPGHHHGYGDYRRHQEDRRCGWATGSVHVRAVPGGLAVRPPAEFRRDSRAPATDFCFCIRPHPGAGGLHRRGRSATRFYGE